METLGHSRLSTTAIYQHVMPAMSQEVADQMEALISG